MIPRFFCALNGVNPESIDATLRVTDITELPPRRRVVTAPTIRHGLRLLSRVRESLTIRIRFLIAQYDPARRRDLLQKLHAWADPGGILTTSDRPGQQLQVDCDTLPMLTALCWSDEISIEFTAYAVPFWEYAEETQVSSDEGTFLLLPGDAEEAPVSCDVTNQGAAPLTTLRLVCGDTQMCFEGLSIAPGDVFRLSVENGLLRAESGGESLLIHRTGDSDDLLLADCGMDAGISATGDQIVTAVFHARGRLL